jgi:hypothetical protein
MKKVIFEKKGYFFEGIEKGKKEIKPSAQREER